MRIEVDTSALGERAIGLEKLIREHLESSFSANELGLFEAQGQDEPFLRVRIEVLNLKMLHYNLHFEYVVNGEAETLVDPVECLECFDREMKGALDTRTQALIVATTARVARGTGEPSGDGDPGPESNADDGNDPPIETTPKPRRLGALGVTGGVLLVAGVGVAIGGAFNLGRGIVYDDPAPPALDGYRAGLDHRPTGAALLGAGIGCAVAGGALLVVYLVLRSKNAHKNPQNHKGAGLVIPTVSPSAVGLGYVRHF